MIGNYLRVSQEDFDRLERDPSEVVSLVFPEDDEHPPGRHLDIDKAWHAIHFLLTGDPWGGAAPLRDAVMGGCEVGEEDVGYGPARLLTSAEVQAVASALALISGDDLWSRFDATAFAQADIYPQGLEETDKDYVVVYYEALRRFFSDAATANDAMLVYLN